jgi:hypothetical protein
MSILALLKRFVLTIISKFIVNEHSGTQMTNFLLILNAEKTSSDLTNH